MREHFKLPLTRQKKKIELGTISRIDQYGYAYHHAKFGACIKNRTFHELRCRRTKRDGRDFVCKTRFYFVRLLRGSNRLQRPRSCRSDFT